MIHPSKFLFTLLTVAISHWIMVVWSDIAHKLESIILHKNFISYVVVFPALQMLWVSLHLTEMETGFPCLMKWNLLLRVSQGKSCKQSETLVIRLCFPSCTSPVGKRERLIYWKVELMKEKNLTNDLSSTSVVLQSLYMFMVDF